MKTTLKIALMSAFGAMLLVGCTKDYEGDFASINGRLSDLESSVSSLQGQIEKGAVITSVDQIANGIKINLSDKTSYEITNGTNGVNGKDGQIVTIGNDGYWYIDNVKTEYPAQGPKGDKGDTGAAGAQGPKGDTGAAGAQGPKGDTGAAGVAGNYWVPNVEKNLWEEFSGADGKATGKTKEGVFAKGTVTAVWANDKLTLSNVEGANGPVVIDLSKALESVAILPVAYLDGVPVVFYSNTAVFDTTGSVIKSFENPVTVKYRLNPSTADVTKATWSFINRDVAILTKVEGDKTDLVEIKDNTVNGGVAAFDINFKRTPKWDTSADSYIATEIIAVQAKIDDDVITSDYAYLRFGATDTVKNFQIIHKDKDDAIYPYRTTELDETSKADSEIEPKTPVLEGNETLNLADYVETYVVEKNAILAEAGLGMTAVYKYELVKGTGVTLTDAVVKATDDALINGGYGVIKVTSVYDGKTLAVAYIKVNVGNQYKLIHKDGTAIVYYREAQPAAADKSDKELQAPNTPAFPAKAVVTDQIALADYVETYVANKEKKLAEAGLGLTATYTYEVVDGAENVTLTDGILKPTEKAVNDGGYAVIKVTSKAGSTKLCEGYIKVDIAMNHDHDFITDNIDAAVDTSLMLLNGDYILGKYNTLKVVPKADAINLDTKWDMIGGVKVLGKPADGVLNWTSSIIEHFDEYTVPEMKEGTIRFTVQNYDETQVKYLAPAGTDSFSVGTATVDGKNVSYVEFTAEEWNKICNSEARSASTSNGPEIQLIGSALLGTANNDVLVEVTETCGKDAAQKLTSYYYVVFVKTYFKVEITDIVLGTYKEKADEEFLAKHITIKDNKDKVIFSYNATKDALVPTQYAKDEYAFTDSDVVKVEASGLKYYEDTKDTKKSFDDCLYIPAAKTSVVWDNMGTDLQLDKIAGVNVKIDINGKYDLEQLANVKVLSTANTAVQKPL